MKDKLADGVAEATENEIPIDEKKVANVQNIEHI